MKIAIILSSAAIAPTGGVKLQGIMWRDGLEKLGHEVELVDFWKSYDWDSFDSIIILGAGQAFKSLMACFSKINTRLYCAPIIDPLVNKYMFRFIVQGGPLKKLSWLVYRNKNYAGIHHAHRLLARSPFEKEYIRFAFGIPEDRIDVVPLSFRTPPISNMPQKEPFCLHVSRLDAPGKNVNRLILAAKKYHFPLILAGHLYGQQGLNNLNAQIAGCENIHYVGMLSDKELCDYYHRAKVFALPSLEEGVGMVALEAAAYGCEIVLTNLGAPKQYYDGRARLVNPRSVDDIGQAIVDCLAHGYSQPELMSFIQDKYNLTRCTKLLSNILEKK